MRLLIGRLLLWFIEPARAEQMAPLLAQMRKTDESYERWWQARREAARRGTSPSVDTAANGR